MVSDVSIKIRNFFSYGRAFLHYLLPSERDPHADYLSIAACIKNEGLYLVEWIEYHKMLGVTRFYLYDAATDNTKEVLAPYIETGEVVYHEARKRGIQIPIYNDVLCRYRNASRWIAFLDLDEFIGLEYPYETIPQLLQEYEAYPGLGINWIQYDSNGHIQKPEGLVIKNFTRVLKNSDEEINRHIKSIIDPKCAMFTTSPHWFVCNPLKKHHWVVDENFVPVVGAFTEHNSVHKVRIAHYHFKSREEYEKKCRRGLADSMKQKYLVMTENSGIFFENKQDTMMLKYVDRLESILKSKAEVAE